MDRKLRKVLTECIRDIETGARDVEGCLQRHAEWATELRPHLELWSGLNAATKAEPSLGGQQRGQQRLEAALSEAEREGGKRMIPFLTPALAKVGAAAVAAVLLIGGAAGGSAALGGPDVAGEVLSGVGAKNTSEPDREQEREREQERDKASDDSADGDDDAHETPEADREQEREREQEAERSSESPGGADDSINHTPEAEREQEMDREQQMERASEGSGNAGDSSGNGEGRSE